MKQISSFMNRNRRFMLMAAAALITALLFLFGGHAHAGATLATAGAAITLTEEEKAGFTEGEQKMLLAVKKLIAVKTDEVNKGLLTTEEGKKAIKEMKDGLTTTEIKALKDEIEKLEGILKTQGLAMKALQETGAGGPDGTSFEEAWEANLDAIKDLRATQNGIKRFYFGEYLPEKKEDGSVKGKPKNAVDGIKSLFRKAAGVTSVANSTASSPTSITNPYSPFPTQLPDIIAVRRNPNLALNFVDRGTTNSAVITWTEEGNSEGDAAVTAEGAIKPLQDKKFTDRLSKAKKVAGHFILTEEMENDTPRIATAVRRLFEENVMRKYDDQVYADIIAVVGGYVSTALDDQIDNADDYAAIGAALCQLSTLNATGDLIVLNPADRWRMRLTKSTGDGQYLLPPFTVNGQSFDGITVVISNKVAAGNFLVGESKTYKVDEYKPFSIRVGWQNDDLVKNQVTVVGEVRFHSYIATNDLVAWCYSSFATVKAQIEKP